MGLDVSDTPTKSANRVGSFMDDPTLLIHKSLYNFNIYVQELDIKECADLSAEYRILKCEVEEQKDKKTCHGSCTNGLSHLHKKCHQYTSLVISPERLENIDEEPTKYVDINRHHHSKKHEKSTDVYQNSCHR